MSNIEFLTAKANHINWRIRLLNYLEGKESLSHEEVLSHTDCRLGKWIYAQGMEKYGQLKDMQQLEEIHKQLHEATAKVVLLKEQGKHAEAGAEYEKMKQLSEKLIQTLEALDKQVEASL
jgi:methyl-accepting chemotaxis protein